jgi:hypothetical protein
MAELRTMKVKRLVDDVECVINRDDFDASKHQSLSKERERLTDEDIAAVEVAQPTPNSSGNVPDGDLPSLTVDALQELPEWETVENKDQLGTKDQIVGAILDVRHNQ